MLKKRFISAVIMIPIPVLAVFFGNPYFAFLGALVGMAMAWEWQQMLDKKCDVYALLAASITAIICILTIDYPYEALILTILASLGFAAASYKEYKKLKKLGFIYIALPLLSLIWLREETSYAFVFWVIGLVLATDIGGYLFGCTFKGPLLMPKISPKKTWAGLLGGMLLASVAGVIYAHFMAQDIVLFAIVSAGLAVVSQVGDFFESGIKRKLGIKDSSNLIPGHGGVFDRIDGLLFVAPLVALVVLIEGLL